MSMRVAGLKVWVEAAGGVEQDEFFAAEFGGDAYGEDDLFGLGIFVVVCAAGEHHGGGFSDFAVEDVAGVALDGWAMKMGQLVECGY